MIKFQYSKNNTILGLFGNLCYISLLVWLILIYKSDVELNNKILFLENQLALNKNEISIVKKQKFVLDAFEKKYPDFYKIVSNIYDIALEKNVDPRVALSIVDTESNFNIFAKSQKQSYGLFQINFPVWRLKYDINDVNMLYDHKYNTNLGLTIFADILKRYNNDLKKSLNFYCNGYKNKDSKYYKKVLESKYMKINNQEIEYNVNIK